MNFSSDNIQLFLAVLDRGSFSAAARALQRVPSAVSMAIGNLEAELGYSLFERGSREVRPTAKALALEPHARLIAEQLGLLQVHALELSQGLESSLSVAVVPDIDHRPLLAAIASLGERHPLLDIALLSAPQEEALHLLDSGRADLCVAFAGLQVDARRSFQHIGVESLVATLSPTHPALREGRIHYLEDLTGCVRFWCAAATCRWLTAPADRRHTLVHRQLRPGVANGGSPAWAGATCHCRGSRRGWPTGAWYAWIFAIPATSCSCRYTFCGANNNRCSRPHGC